MNVLPVEIQEIDFDNMLERMEEKSKEYTNSSNKLSNMKLEMISRAVHSLSGGDFEHGIVEAYNVGLLTTKEVAMSMTYTQLQLGLMHMLGESAQQARAVDMLKEGQDLISEIDTCDNCQQMLSLFPRILNYLLEINMKTLEKGLYEGSEEKLV